MAIITASVKNILNNKLGAHTKRVGLGTLMEGIETAIVTGVADDDITTAKILNANVTADKLATNSVTTAKIVAEAVTTAKIADAQITAGKLATSAVETAKINNLAVTAAKLAADAVETAKILNANVTAAKLASNAVETAKIADANVTEAKLAAPSATTLNVKRCLLGVLDATAGKIIGTHAIACQLPIKAIVTRIDYEVITTCTSATDAATIALTLQTANDVITATAIDAGDNIWDAAVPKVTLVTGATAAYIKCSAARTLSAVVAVEDLTAGVVRIYADYVMSV